MALCPFSRSASVNRTTLFATLLLACGWLAGSPTAKAVVFGDLDGDGRVTAGDAVMALRMVLAIDSPTPAQIQAGDIAPMPEAGANPNQPWGDGRITVADVIVLLREVVGMPAPPFPAPGDNAVLSAIQRDVFTPSCAVSSCHSANTKRADLDLSAGHAYASLTNVATSLEGASQSVRVVPFHPEQSFLLTKLVGPGPHDGAQMPFGTDGLDSLTIARIRTWIARGAPPDAGDMTGPPSSQPGITEDVSLPPPPPGKGFQVIIGPFDVPRGQEIFPTYYQKLPNDTTVDVMHIEYATNPGTHHMYVSQLPGADLPDGMMLNTGTLFTGGEQTMSFVQNRYVDQVMPPGVVFRMEPHQQLEIQLHYVNAGTQITPTGRGKVVMNFWTEPPDPSHVPAKFFQTSNSDLKIPPHSTVSFTLPYTFSKPVHVFALWGHFHSRGKDFTIQRYDGTTAGEKVYESATWDDPQYQSYAPPVDVPGGQGFFGTATYENDGDTTIVAGPYVETNEHMFMMGLYYER